MLKKLLSLILLTVSIYINAQTVNIPDANFKNYLVSNSAINTNGDSEIQLSEASAFTGAIDCSFGSITNLQGIEAFTALTSLRTHYNILGSIDLSSNIALTDLDLSSSGITNIDLPENSALTNLDISGNYLTELTLTNSNLTSLNCSYNELTSLILTGVPALITLDCAFNDFTELNLGLCPLLQNFYCSYHFNLFSLDVTNNPALVVLDCHYNSLTSLTLGNHPLLTTLYCGNNGIEELNLSQCPALSIVDMNGINAKEIDMSNCPALTSIQCTNLHDMHTLNLQNGNNENITDFTVHWNANLSCILVDDVAYSNANWNNGSIDDNTFRNECDCIVYIPDDNLRFFLRFDLYTDIDTNNDNWIQCSEAAAFNGYLDCHGEDIADATGLEAFPNIISLDIRNNLLTSLDVSSNPLITYLGCEANDLTSLIITQENAALTQLSCDYNPLEVLSIDTPSLQSLSCSGTSLTSIDISPATALTTFWGSDSPLTSLNINTSNLTSLYCPNNQLTTLNVQNAQNLTVIACDNNLLTSINVEGCTALVGITCSNNYLTSLDFSANPEFEDIDCSNNHLTQLNLNNGNGFSFISSFNALNNPDLTCIQVNYVLGSNTYWTQRDPWATFSLDCGYNNVTIPDADFLAYLLANIDINTNGDTAIDYDEAAAFSGTIECNGLSIEDLTGIEAFINITGLDCSDNLLTTLNVSNNTALITLDCSGNAITQLISGKYAAGSNMQYNVLNLANNPYLQYLNCSDNQLTNLDISNNTALIFLDCSNNQLITLNAANTNNTNFTAFNALNNPTLTCIQVDDDTWSNSQWANIDETSSFSENCDLVGIADALLKNIALYPNPASTTLSMQLPENVSINSVLVTDITGKVVKQQDNNENHINIQNLAAGYYIITVNTSAGRYINKFIKE